MAGWLGECTVWGWWVVVNRREDECVDDRLHRQVARGTNGWAAGWIRGRAERYMNRLVDTVGYVPGMDAYGLAFRVNEWMDRGMSGWAGRWKMVDERVERRREGPLSFSRWPWSC